MSILSILIVSAPCFGQEVFILDDFEYADDGALWEFYVNSGWGGTGDPYLSTESAEGAACMQLEMDYTGAAWGAAGVSGSDVEPFTFGDYDRIHLLFKGDPTFTNPGVVMVLSFFDVNGEVIRYLDYAAPESSDWMTLQIPAAAFEESPWDPNPEVPADRTNLVRWDFTIQGVDGNETDGYFTTVFLDDFKIMLGNPPVSVDDVFDDFERYADDAALQAFYLSNGQGGSAVPSLSTDSTEGAASMQLDLSYTGDPWGQTGVSSGAVPSFALSDDQAISFSIKGDPTLTNPGVVLVVSFFDAAGEQIRYLDDVAPTVEEWTTYTFPVSAFVEGPWDPNPDVAADRSNLIRWDFLIQAVDGNATEPFAATVLIDDFKTVSVTPPDTTVDYIVNRIAPSDAPDVMDTAFDAVYADTGEAMATWEDDGFAPVSEPYSNTRAYLITDGTNVYCGMLIADPDTSTLRTDTANDTLLKWQVDSWEIVFAPHAGQEDGQNYVKFAGDSAGNWDDIFPDVDGGTDWNAPSFQSNAYIVDANTWAAEFSVAITDIADMIVDYSSYGHVGMQVKEPDHNFAYPDRAGFGSRNARWDFSVLDPATPVGDWPLFQ